MPLVGENGDGIRSNSKSVSAKPRPAAATVPLILKSNSDCIAFQFGAIDQRVVDQLQQQPRAECAQLRFNLAEKERELKAALRELAEVRYELAKRDRAFGRAPNPSTMTH